MKRQLHTFLILLLGVACTVGNMSCSKQDQKPDASGAFEAIEVMVSAEASGQLRDFRVAEGDSVGAGTVVAHIDDVQLQLKRKQVQSQISAVLSRQPDAASQLATIQEQLSVARREQQRFTQLMQAGATTSKVVDDVNGQVQILEKQYEALKQSLSISSGGLKAETLPLLAQIEQLNDQIAKCTVVNPLSGTVLTKYSEQFEIVTPGKALYKIADLSVLNLRAYISGSQLSQLKLGQTVRVYVDAGASAFRELSGTVSWIASKAEFTPKTIQTKEERSNLVYAIKVSVKNDGALKIGMYGEIRL